MKTMLTMVAIVALASITTWAAPAAGDKAEAKQGSCCKAGDTMYACATCGMADVKTGKCTKCSADLSAMRVLAKKKGMVSMCACAADCKCTVKADDATQCSCGKPVVSIKCAIACKPMPRKADAPKADADAPKADAPKADAK